MFDAAASSRRLAAFMPEAATDWAFILRTSCSSALIERNKGKKFAKIGAFGSSITQLYLKLIR
jgi:hypothetical protein